MGFKSVLHLCDAPEIYSVAREASRVPDGFTFRFARPDDYDALAREVAPERAGFADHLKENLLTLKVPVFLEEAPKSVHNFVRRGFVTVVRLPLKSADARPAAGSRCANSWTTALRSSCFLTAWNVSGWSGGSQGKPGARRMTARWRCCTRPAA
ncbi:hypothetical protein SFUMM280S_09028 [Streptomyces fumanus]